MFQSLIHQVSVSFGVGKTSLARIVSSFNPLFIRSVFLLNGFKITKEQPSAGFNPLFIRSVFLLKQQRLLLQTEQVSIPYSSGQCFFYILGIELLDHIVVCFNPLFIRSVFLLRVNTVSWRQTLEKFQSLIHQVSVSFLDKTSNSIIFAGSRVSIPYSSGQCFF